LNPIAAKRERERKREKLETRSGDLGGNLIDSKENTSFVFS
jgi:hypothetical protein